MSKIDELHETYCLAVKSYMNSNGGALIWDAERAGIAAVVRAVRDEFGRIMYPGDDWNRQGILEQFDQILGDAGEKVAGASAREGEAAGELRTPSARSPATDPAPAVCVWTKLPKFGFSISCTDKWLMNSNYGGDTCPECGRLIEYKFTEAKT